MPHALQHSPRPCPSYEGQRPRKSLWRAEGSCFLHCCCLRCWTHGGSGCPQDAVALSRKTQGRPICTPPAQTSLAPVRSFLVVMESSRFVAVPRCRPDSTQLAKEHGDVSFPWVSEEIQDLINPLGVSGSVLTPDRIIRGDKQGVPHTPWHLAFLQPVDSETSREHRTLRYVMITRSSVNRTVHSACLRRHSAAPDRTLHTLPPL